MILPGGGLGESTIGAIQRSSSLSNAWPGKSDAVCPSGPIPRRIKSKMGNRAESLDANSWMRSFSYASARSSSASSASGDVGVEVEVRAGGRREVSMWWMLERGMGTLEKSSSMQSLWFESGWSSGTARSSA